MSENLNGNNLTSGNQQCFLIFLTVSDFLRESQDLRQLKLWKLSGWPRWRIAGHWLDFSGMIF